MCMSMGTGRMLENVTLIIMQETLREVQRVKEIHREKGSSCGWDKEKELEVIHIYLYK